MTFQMGLSLELITTLLMSFASSISSTIQISFAYTMILFLMPLQIILIRKCLVAIPTSVVNYSVIWMCLWFAKWLEEEDWNPHKSQETINSMLKSDFTSCDDDGWIPAETSSWTSECFCVPAMTRPQPFRLTFMIFTWINVQSKAQLWTHLHQ